MATKPNPPPNPSDPRFPEWLFALWDWVTKGGRLLISQLSTSGLTANQVLATDTANSAVVGKTMSATSPVVVTHSNTAIALTHANSGAAAGVYGNASAVPQFNVNVTGHIQSASNVAISITASQVTDFNEAAQDAVGGIVVGTGNVTLTYNDSVPSIAGELSSTGVTAGVYGNSTTVPQITVDVKGRLTSAGNVTITSYPRHSVTYNTTVADGDSYVVIDPLEVAANIVLTIADNGRVSVL